MLMLPYVDKVSLFITDYGRFHGVSFCVRNSDSLTIDSCLFDVIQDAIDTSSKSKKHVEHILKFKQRKESSETLQLKENTIYVTLCVCWRLRFFVASFFLKELPQKTHMVPTTSPL